MRLGDSKFFNLFALVAATSNPDRACDLWDIDRVKWRRERTSRRGPDYSFQIELHTLNHEGRHGWTLLLGHETFWTPERTDAFRNGRWVHLVKGARGDAIKWFEKQEKELDL